MRVQGGQGWGMGYWVQVETQRRNRTHQISNIRCRTKACRELVHINVVVSQWVQLVMLRQVLTDPELVWEIAQLCLHIHD